MLPADMRMRDARQFRAVLRDRHAGRAGGTLLVVHAVDTDALDMALDERDVPRVGFVVSKAVGNAVVRARTKRILRHLAREHVADIPVNFDVVVRANPAIAGKPSREVDAEFSRMLAKAVSRAKARAQGTSA